MIVQPKIRGFICTTAHPKGCQDNVINQINYIKSQDKFSGPKKVLIIGSSTGYGLASRITAAFGANAQTLGISFEKKSNGKKTASAGWYNTAAFEQEANKCGLYAKSINGDAFSDEIKQQAIDIIQEDWNGKVDLVIYSLASPKRIHPKTKQIFNSTLKPIGEKYTNKTIDVLTGKISEVTFIPATNDEINNTIEVMGGEDWSLWIDSLLKKNLLAKNCQTVAYSYIGPKLTYPVYRNGTIGKAKEHLEATAIDLNKKLASLSGKAYISVNKGLVTQASSAIPVVPLYLSILYKVMKRYKIHEGCIEQMSRLFSKNLYSDKLNLDNMNRIRIDDLEMRDDVQHEVDNIWNKISNENLSELSDIEGYKKEFYSLFGFNLTNVDYNKDVNIKIDIPSLTSEKEGI